MTIEGIIRMAKQAGFYIEEDQANSSSNKEDFKLTEHLKNDLIKHLERFAKLVAEHERNEIIEILDASTGYVHMDAIRERT
jgi:DNA-binding transcriptional regulator YhcF (GntR family)